MMTEEDFKAMRKRCAATTEGPWRPERHDCDSGDILHQVWSVSSSQVATCVDDGAPNRPKDDAEFIAHARTDLPAALDEIERLKELLDSETCRYCDSAWEGLRKRPTSRRSPDINAAYAQLEANEGLDKGKK